MLAWLTLAGLGAAVPHALRSKNSAEIAIYQAVAERAMQIKRDAMKK
jgi:hypothetical protein